MIVIIKISTMIIIKLVMVKIGASSIISLFVYPQGYSNY